MMLLVMLVMRHRLLEERHKEKKDPNVQTESRNQKTSGSEKKQNKI
jgi:hypothetical protein